jgi:hypothetical protein
MKVTVIIDNAVPIGTGQPFLAEHGLSLLIEHAPDLQGARGGPRVRQIFGLAVWESGI